MYSALSYPLGNADPVSWTSFSGADCFPMLGDTVLPSVSNISYTVTYNQRPRVKGVICAGLFSEVGGCIHEMIKDLTPASPYPQLKLHCRNGFNGELLILFKNFEITDHSLSNDMDQIITYEYYNFQAKDVEYYSPARSVDSTN